MSIRYAKYILLTLLATVAGLAHAEGYPLFITNGGTFDQVTQDNCGDLTVLSLVESGTVSYDADNKILTLENAQLNGGIQNGSTLEPGIEGLTIVLKGKNTIVAGGYVGFAIISTTTIKGMEGSTLTVENANTLVYVEGTPAITIEDCNITCTPKMDGVVSADDLSEFTLRRTSLKAEFGEDAFSTIPLKIEDCEDLGGLVWDDDNFCYVKEKKKDGTIIPLGTKVDIIVPVQEVGKGHAETGEVKPGADLTLKPELKPKNATYKKLEWSSSDESVATVDGDGKVRALKPGTTTITAKAIGVGGKEVVWEYVLTVPGAASAGGEGEGSGIRYVAALLNTPVSAIGRNQLALYPNPATTSLRIVGMYSPTEVEIFNIDGRSIRRQEVAPGGMIGVGDLAAGAYILRWQGRCYGFVKR